MTLAIVNHATVLGHHAVTSAAVVGIGVVLQKPVGPVAVTTPIGMLSPVAPFPAAAATSGNKMAVATHDMSIPVAILKLVVPDPTAVAPAGAHALFPAAGGLKLELATIPVAVHHKLNPNPATPNPVVPR